MSFLGGVSGNLAGALGVGSIGRATVALVLDTRQYQAGLAGAKGETEASTASMGKSFDALKTAAVAGAGLAAVAVAKFAADSVSAAVDAQESQLKLANAVENSKNVTASSIPVFQAQAQALRDLTGVDDDLINAGQSIFVNMGLQQDQISQLTPLVVDLSAKYGIDLNAAFKAVGKAVEGNTGGLARYIGVIQKGATPAETFDNVLKKLGATAGFAAQQAKDQPWRLLSAAIQQAQEDIGAKLLPILQKLVPTLTELAKNILPLLGDAFANSAEQAGPMLEVLNKLIELSSQGAGAADSHTSSIQSFANTLLGTFNPAAKTAVEGYQEYSRVSAEATTAQDELNKKVLEGAGITSETLPKWEELGRQIAAQNGFAMSAAQGTATLSASEEAAAHATEAATQAAKDHTQALQDEWQASLKGAQGILGLADDLQQLKVDQAAVNALQRQGKLDTAEGAAAIRQLTSDQIAYRQDLQGLRQDLRSSNLTFADAKQRLKEFGEQAGLSKQQIQDATTKLQGFNSALDHLNSLPDSKTVNIHVNATATFAGDPLLRQHVASIVNDLLRHAQV